MMYHSMLFLPYLCVMGRLEWVVGQEDEKTFRDDRKNDAKMFG